MTIKSQRVDGEWINNETQSRDNRTLYIRLNVQMTSDPLNIVQFRIRDVSKNRVWEFLKSVHCVAHSRYSSPVSCTGSSPGDKSWVFRASDLLLGPSAGYAAASSHM